MHSSGKWTLNRTGKRRIEKAEIKVLRQASRSCPHDRCYSTTVRTKIGNSVERMQGMMVRTYPRIEICKDGPKNCALYLQDTGTCICTKDNAMCVLKRPEPDFAGDDGDKGNSKNGTCKVIYRTSLNDADKLWSRVPRTKTNKQ